MIILAGREEFTHGRGHVEEGRAIRPFKDPAKPMQRAANASEFRLLCIGHPVNRRETNP
jgi:hypothetical protein